MNHLEFYKYIYDRELNRRSKLDDSINPIVGIISLLIGYVSFIFSNENFFEYIECNTTLWVFFSISTLLTGFSIFFLIKSYNNHLRGFNYPNFSYLQQIREYQIKTIPNYNNKVNDNLKINFDDELIERMIIITDENTKINDKRSYDLYLSKTFIILTLISIFIISIILIAKNTQLC